MPFQAAGRFFAGIRKKLYAGRLWAEIAPDRFIRYFFAIFCGVMLLWLLIAVFFDPYIFWHRAFGFHQVYSNSYAMIPSILRHYDYDTVLVGSSLTKNFRISDINSILDGRAVKATAAGAHGDDWLVFMQEALAARKVRRFVLCADLWAFTREDKPCRHKSYGFMYGCRNFIPYVYSLDTLKAIGEVLQNHLPGKPEEKAMERDFDLVFFDPIRRYTYSQTALERSISIQREYTPPPRAKTDPEEYLEKYIFSLVRRHQDVQFDLFLAPCSIYMWCAIREQGDLEAYLDTRSRLAGKCALYPNVRLFDLQAREEIVCNLDNYKDITHYSPEINRRILQLIAASKNGDSADSVKSNNAKLRLLVDRHAADFLCLRQTGAVRPEN